MPNELGLFSYNSSCPDAYDLNRYRSWLEKVIRQNIDGGLLLRFDARFPKPGDFSTPMNIRRFLGHNTEPDLPGTSGIDRPVNCGRRANPAGLLAHGSMLPDTDKRNQNRLWHKEDGAVETDRYGRAIPIDPIALNMGNRTGLSSQAHAHYFIPYKDLSDDPDTLKDRPERFAVSMGWPEKEVKTFGDSQAQMHYDLAALTTFWSQDHPADQNVATLARGIAWLHLGASLHYVQDAGNPIHNVQIGLYDFFKTAKIQSILENFLTAGGLLFDRMGFYQRGLNILSNHHLISEAIAEAIIFANTEQFEMAPYPGYDPPQLAENQDPWSLVSDHPSLFIVYMSYYPARDLVQHLGTLGAPEASNIYALTFEVTSGSLHKGSSTVPDEPTRVGNLLTRNTSKGAEVLRALDPLLRRPLMRTLLASQLLIRRFHQDFVHTRETATTPQSGNSRKAVVRRLVAERLNAMDAEDSRRSAFRHAPPEPSEEGVGWLYFFADLVIIILFASIWTRFRRRRYVRKAERYASSFGRPRKRLGRRRSSR
jgi:hypothetical protein